jgi:hypothetical protein
MMLVLELNNKTFDMSAAFAYEDAVLPERGLGRATKLHSAVFIRTPAPGRVRPVGTGSKGSMWKDGLVRLNSGGVIKTWAAPYRWGTVRCSGTNDAVGC